MDIHKCLEALQDTLQQLSSSVNGMAKIPASKSGLLLPDGFYQNTYSARTVLTVPLEDIDTPKYYGQYILKLFVTAQQLEINASYPSGILHEYINGNHTKYMFLTITPENEDNAPIPSDNKSIRILPEGTYICRRIANHMSGSVAEEMKEVLRNDSFCIIETDTSSAENKKNGYPFELQYYVE